MPRKLLISFLGNTNYQPTRYYTSNPNRPSEPLRFAPEATLQFHCADFTEQDEVLIFTTTEAFEKNWKDAEHLNWQTKEKEFQVGLENRLNQTGFPCVMKAIPIEEGKKTSEIWAIFKTVFDQMQDGDQVVFDITYGFRSIPMLSMVLINYARFLKNISVRGIYYGAFEAKEKNDNGDDCTPIWDLTPFAELQDWSIAAGEFIRHGKTADLVSLVEKDQPALATQLHELEQNILHCRGMELLQKTDYEGMKKTLADTRNEAIAAQLQPLIEKIEIKMEDFKNEQSTLHNGYAAVNWCVQHDMTQQGVTILQETMKTFLIEKYFGASNITKYPYRELVNGALWCRGVERNGAFGKDDFKALSTEELDKLKIIYTEMLDFIKSKKKLSTLYIQLTNAIRNDINHGGFQEPYRSAGELKDSFHKLFTQIKALPL